LQLYSLDPLSIWNFEDIVLTNQTLLISGIGYH